MILVWKNQERWCFCLLTEKLHEKSQKSCLWSLPLLSCPGLFSHFTQPSEDHCREWRVSVPAMDLGYASARGGFTALCCDREGRAGQKRGN